MDGLERDDKLLQEVIDGMTPPKVEPTEKYEWDIMKEQEGCFNETADVIPRIDEVWSDTNLDKDFVNCPKGAWWWKPVVSFKRLKCRNCGGLSFEVLKTDDYETSARCDKCGMYYIVHCG